MNLRKISTSILVSVSLGVIACLRATACAADAEITVWHPVAPKAGAKYLFVTLQESQFIREKIGDWLPLTLIKLGENDDVYYSVKQVTRVENHKLKLEVVIYNKTQAKVSSVITSWTMPAEAKVVEIVDTKPGVIEFRYPETGEIREVRIAPIIDIEAGQTEFKISRAAPLWKWGASDWERKAPKE